jgi:replicative DNA helicase
MIEAQQSLLASMLLDSDCLVDVLDSVSVSDFTTAKHKNIVDAIFKMANEGQEIDILSVADKTDELPYLTDLATNCSRMNVKAAIGLIKRDSVRRKSLSNLERATQQVLEAETVDEQLIALEGVTDGVDVGTEEFSTFAEIMNRSLSRMKDKLEGNAPEGLKTGFHAIDERLGGLVNGNMIVIGGRPSMGKTTYAMNVAENIAETGKNVLVFSLEMSAEEIADRMIACASGVPNHIIRKPTEDSFDIGQQQKITIGMNIVKKREMTIIDKGGLHIDHLRNIARKFNRVRKVDLIVIDYLQLLRSDEKNRFDEISAISRNIKALAKELDLPIIVLSQLSREVDKRSDSRPINSDLRESGQIEQDADIIQFLYRDEVYNDKDSNPNKGLAEVITRKFRNGEIGTDYLDAELYCSRFKSTQRSHQEPQSETYAPAYGRR